MSAIPLRCVVDASVGIQLFLVESHSEQAHGLFDGLTADLMEAALTLAAQTGLTAYDACYAALARRLNLPLVTAHEPLAKAISWAIWLGDLEAPKG